MDLSSPTHRRNDAPEGLFLARDGTWFHDGTPVRHPRLACLLTRSVARDEEGRLIVTTGRDRLPFQSEDAPLRVRTLRRDEEGLWLVLSDDTEERLAPGAEVSIDEEGRVRSRVKGGRFWALFSRGATQALMADLHDDGGTPVLRVPGGTVRVVSVREPLDWTA